MNVQQSDLSDPALVAEVDLARAAAQEEAGDERVGDYVEYELEDEAAVTHHFEADKPGYQGWRWAVTITSAGPSTDVTVSEVVLLPGPTALVAPEWIPWQYRVQAGDLGVGDLLPTDPDDPRLVPAYLESDDPAVEEAATEAGLGRVRVMSRPARLDAADRWQQSEFGPHSDMARGAPAHCGTCGFYLPLAGSLKAAFGTCGNEMSPADAHVVHAEYGCGAHSEAEVEQVSPVLVADLIYDDALLDVEPLEVIDEVPQPAAETDAPEAPAAEASVVVEEAPAAAEAPVESDAQAADAAVAEASADAVVAEAVVESDVRPAEASADSAVAEPSADAVAPEAQAPVVEPSAAEASADAEPSVEPVDSPVENPAEPDARPADAAAAEPSVDTPAEPAVAELPVVTEPSVEPAADAAVGEPSAEAPAEPEAQPTDAAPSAPETEPEPTEPEPRHEAFTPPVDEGTPIVVSEAAAPADIEPVVTAETSDESTRRE